MIDKAGLLSASDVAKYLNVCEHTVYRWCKNGKIPFYNLSSTYRFDAKEIEQWLRDQHHMPSAGGEDENAEPTDAGKSARAMD